MDSSSYRRILLIAFVVYIVASLALVYSAGQSMREGFLQSWEADLQQLSDRVLEQWDLSPEDTIALIDRFPDPTTRIALFDADGNLLAASPNVALRDGLNDRPDVREAWRNGFGYWQRTADGDVSGSLALSRRFLKEPLSPEAPDPTAANSTSLVLRLWVTLDSLDREIVTLRWYLAVALGVIGLGVFWTFGLIAQTVLSPLHRLVRIARALAQGNLNVSVDLESRQAEWKGLSNAFDQMQQLIATREETLRDYGNRLETTLASMAEGVIAVGGDGTVAFANDAAVRLLSIPFSSLDGKRLYDLVRLPQLIEAYEHSKSRHQSVKTELETVGDPRKILSLRIDPIPGSPNSGSVLVLRDVTEIRQLETMRRDFVANVSHELKTPLSAIKAYAETLRLGAWDDTNHRASFVAEIESQAERLHSLILDLIQLARIESDDFTIVREPTDLGECLEEAIGTFLRVAHAKPITLDLIHVEQPIRAYTDVESLITIADNLISNAIRYTKPDGSVFVRYGETSEWVWFEVEDTGIGIAPEHQARVFERFYRVDRARSRDVGGTGLGLSIVKHLVQALDGSIELTSKVGVGTRIRIKLPRYQPPASAN